MSETALTQDLDAYKRLLEAQQRKRLKKFDKHSLAWLALVPAWTEQLALECHFPVKEPAVEGATAKEQLRNFVRTAQAKKLCLLKQSTNPERFIWHTAYIFTSLASYLSVPRQQEALTFVQSIKDTRLQSQSLIKLIPYLAPELLNAALSSAEKIEKPAARAATLLALMPRFEEQRPIILKEAWDAAQEVSDAEEKAQVLLMLLQYYPEDRRTELLQQLFGLLRQEMTEAQQVEIVIGMAPYLPPTLLPSALEFTQTLTQHDEQVQVWLALAEYAPLEERRSILYKARDILVSDLDMEQATRTSLLGIVAQELASEGEFDPALTMTDEISDEETRVHTYIEIVHTLSQHGKFDKAKEQIERLLKTTLRQMDAAWNVTILSSIAQILMQIRENERAKSIAQRAFDGLQSLLPTMSNITIFSSLATVLTQIGEQAQAKQTLDRGLVAARAINDTRDRCKALTSLVRYVPAPQQEKEVQGILETTRQIGEIDARIQGLINIAPYLNESELHTALDEALRLAKTMEEEFSFWMPDSTRAEVLAMLAQDEPLQDGSSFLLHILQEIAPPILQAQQTIPIAPAVIRWAEIAAQAVNGTEVVAYWLDDKIEQLVDAGDTGLALAWINTATTLLPILQGELEMSVILGKRRVEMAYRQAQDQRHLQDFLQRQDQIDAFMDLIATAQTDAPRPDSPWALHYVGMGGVGKTTLLRYITAKIAHDKNIPVSRIDFDYLNPDYPSRRPGQLLIELAKELQSYSKSLQHEALFRGFQQRVVHFHEVLSSQPTPADPLASIHHPDFTSVIQTFTDFLSSLAQPVVLILDTCEELAKFQPKGASLPNVEATFHILEHIHDAIPSVRVVFAGRRLLVREGNDWWLDQQHLQEGQSLLRTKKSYLRLHEIKGFTEKEARDFLTTSKKLDIPVDLQQAILQRSPDADMISYVQWHSTHTNEPGQRYNPFDLALYADWVREDANVTAQMINEGTTDPYIEQRIIQRVRQPSVSALLPTAILLRRFNKDMLRLAFDGDDIALDEAFRDVGNLEWIGYQPEEKTTFLEIDRNLYPRLLDYYQHPDSDRRAFFATTRQRLIPALFTLIVTVPLDQLYVEYVEAALRILPTKDGAELWDRVMQRLLQGADWSKIRTITRHILDDSTTYTSNVRTTTLLLPNHDTAIIGPLHQARAAVRASYIAVLLHDRPDMRVDSFWKEVIQYADNDPRVAQWLSRRARAGNIATIRVTRELPPNEQLNEFWKLVRQFPQCIDNGHEYISWHTEQLAASLCAALDALLEFAEWRNMRQIVPDPQWVADWASLLREHRFADVLQAFATMLAGRAMTLYTRPGEADTLSAQANTTLPSNSTQAQHQQWADWLVPDSLHDRVRLEIVRAIPRHQFSLSRDTLLNWQQEAISRLPSIDADRLISYILTLRLAQTVVPKTELDVVATHDVYRPQRRPLCKAHRDIYPLFAARTTALLALGESAAALRLVNERIEAVTKIGLDQENTIQTAKHAKARILRRMRAAKIEPIFVESLALAKDMRDRVVIWPAIALCYPPNSKLIPSAPITDNLFDMHDWWRNSLINRDTAALLQDKVRTLSSHLLANFAEVSLIMDAWEAQLAIGEKAEEQATEQFDFTAWLAHHPTHIEQALRLWLRAIALGRAIPGSSAEIQNEWAERVGARRIAELALREGEVLALRLPQNAQLLLNLAYRLFRKADDAVGTFIASLCSTIAYIRAGVPIADDTRQTLENRLKEAYEELPQLSDSPWIPWGLLHNHLTRADSRLDGNEMLWQGWLERMVTCMLWLNEDKDAFVLWREDSLISQYGDPLPQELDISLPESDTGNLSSKTTGTLAVSIPKSSRNISTSLLLLVALVITVLLLLTALLVLWWEVSISPRAQCGYCSSPSLLDKDDIFLVILGILSPLLLVGGYILGRRLLRNIRTELATRTLLTLNIEGEPIFSWQKLRGATAPPITIQAQQQRETLRFGWPLVYQQPQQDKRWTLSLPDLQAYSDAAHTLPADLVQELATLQKQLRKQTLPVPLTIYPGLHALPWEALFTLALPGAAQQGWHESFQFYRQEDLLQVSQSTPRAQPQENSRNIGVLCSSNWRLITSKGWQTENNNVTVCNNLYDLQQIESRLERKFSILHVICTPTLATSGWLLQIGNIDQQYGVRANSKIEQVVRGDDASRLIRVENLPLAFASLVVLQAEPVETLRRRDSEREQTSELRSCATAAFAAGAKTVLMLPALPSSLTEIVIHQLAECWEDEANLKLQGVLDAISSIRRSIATWTPTTSGQYSSTPSSTLSNAASSVTTDIQQELALDVSLFTRM